jgi:hypothetical protein
MEDADGILFISEGSIPTIGWNKKKLMAMKDEEWEVLDIKGTRNIHG